MRRLILAGAAALLCGGLSLIAAAPAAPPQDLAEPDLPVTGKADPDLASFDRLMIDFIKRRHVPGGALAVARDGRIVYARGFGYADPEDDEPVKPDALFRIASISKPFTAVAVLQLVEAGKVRLDDEVFDVLGLQEPQDDTVQFDERWKDVTIRQLLQHRGGWDRDKTFDPMFHSADVCKELVEAPPADQDAIIRYMLRRPLDFDPGERYAYSNFGYCLLGRVVEKISACGYEEYVKKHILAPLGIRRMRLGKTLLKDRAPGEVRYFAEATFDAVLGPRLGRPVPSPYGSYCLESMDSCAGWIASAEDLVRFATAFDDPKTCKILGEKSIKTMFARPPGPGVMVDGKPTDYSYGCGWFVRTLDGGRADTWHSGTLNGTDVTLVRRRNGLTWAVLFNSREALNYSRAIELIDANVTRASEEVKHWPSGD